MKEKSQKRIHPFFIILLVEIILFPFVWQYFHLPKEQVEVPCYENGNWIKDKICFEEHIVEPKSKAYFAILDCCVIIFPALIFLSIPLFLDMIFVGDINERKN